MHKPAVATDVQAEAAWTRDARGPAPQAWGTGRAGGPLQDRGQHGTGSPVRACRAAWAIGTPVGEGSASRVATARVKGGPSSRRSSTSPGAKAGSLPMVSVPPRDVATT